MKSYDKIKLAKENLNLAMALLTAAQEGVITKSIITKYIYPSEILNTKWGPLQVADNTNLIRKLNNLVRSSFAFSATTTYKILSVLFPEIPLEETDPYKRNILCTIKLIHDALDGDMITPTWHCPTEYQQKFGIDTIEFVLDATNLHGKSMTWDDLGGLGKYLNLITCCEELAYSCNERNDLNIDYSLQQNNPLNIYTDQFDAITDGLAPHPSNQQQTATQTHIMNPEKNTRDTPLFASLDPKQFPSVDPESAVTFVSTQMVTNPDNMVLAKELYSSYITWCELECIKPLTQRSFGIQLTNMGFSRKRRGKGHHWWTGLKLDDHQAFNFSHTI